MMKILARFAAIVAMVSMLATISFATPACLSCSLNPVQYQSASPKVQAHGHCGSVQVDSREAPRVAASQCSHQDAICMMAAQRETPGLQTGSSLVFFAFYSQSTRLEAAKPLSPPPLNAVGRGPILSLLTANLRV